MKTQVRRLIKSATVISLVVVSTALGITWSNAGSGIAVMPSAPVSSPSGFARNLGTIFQSPANIAGFSTAHPFQTGISITISGGDNHAFGSFAVPAGQELVIQTVSMYRGGAASGSSAQLYITPTVGSGPAQAYAMPPVGDTTTALVPGSTWTGVLYADPGTLVGLTDDRTGNLEYPEVDDIAITGYVLSNGVIQK